MYNLYALFLKLRKHDTKSSFTILRLQLTFDSTTNYLHNFLIIYFFSTFNEVVNHSRNTNQKFSHCFFFV